MDKLIFIVLFACASATNTTNSTAPDVATLRPTTTETLQPTFMPTINHEIVSGEPPRVVVVGINVAFCLGLTVVGIMVVLYGNKHINREPGRRSFDRVSNELW